MIRALRDVSRLPKRRWSFLAATYSGSTLRLYIGTRVAAKVRIRGALRKSAGPLQIGGNQVHGEFFAGSVASVRIFSTSRSPKQLGRDARTRVRNGAVRPQPPRSGPPPVAPPVSSPPPPTATNVVGQGASAGLGLPQGSIRAQSRRPIMAQS